MTNVFGMQHLDPPLTPLKLTSVTLRVIAAYAVKHEWPRICWLGTDWSNTGHHNSPWVYTLPKTRVLVLATKWRTFEVAWKQSVYLTQVSGLFVWFFFFTKQNNQQVHSVPVNKCIKRQYTYYKGYDQHLQFKTHFCTACICEMQAVNSNNDDDRQYRRRRTVCEVKILYRRTITLCRFLK